MKNGCFRSTVVGLMAVATLILADARSSSGEVIASYRFEKSVGTQYSPFPADGQFWLFYTPYSPYGEIPGGEYWPECGPLMSIQFTAADVGSVYTVDSGPAYDVAADCLTNGVLDAASYTFGYGGFGGPETMLWSESYEWHNTDSDWGSINCYNAGSNGIDLQGLQVQSISFRLDAYEPYYAVFTIEVHGAPGVLSVGLDIKPGTSPNTVNINGNGVIPVAILGGADFDVRQVDVSTLGLAGLLVRVKPNGVPQCSIDDVSGPEGVADGYPDLVCQFVDEPDLWIPGEDTAMLTGNLVDGTPISGSDEIIVVP